MLPSLLHLPELSSPWRRPSKSFSLLCVAYCHLNTGRETIRNLLSILIKLQFFTNVHWPLRAMKTVQHGTISHTIKTRKCLCEPSLMSSRGETGAAFSEAVSWGCFLCTQYKAENWNTALLEETHCSELYNPHYLSFIKSRHDKEPHSSWGVDKWMSRTLSGNNYLYK